MKILLSILLCSWATIAKAQSDPTSARAILPGCKSIFVNEPVDVAGALNQGLCYGTVNALLSLHGELAPPMKFCSPLSVSLSQGVRITVAFIEERPQRLNETFVRLAAEALAASFPCAK